MNSNTRVAIAHPDKQHSFQTATALLQAGVLDKYITTVYDKPGSLTHLCTKLTKGVFRTKLQAHRSPAIPDDKVIQFDEFLSLILLVLARVDKNKRFYSRLKIYRDNIFNKKVARYCKKNHISAVISYDVLSAQLYEALEDANTVKILDMSAPYFPEMCEIFEQECKKHPTSSLNSLLQTPLFRYWKAQSEYEINSADAFLVASDFTKRTLTKLGVPESKIYKCAYGLNHQLFNTEDRPKKTSDTLRCVYVGNITEQKGFRYLVEVMKRAKAEALDVDFTIVGAYNPADPLIAEAKSLCTFTGHVMPTKLKQILLSSDVMIFPSLADGFGFAVLEAMACGVVPICSQNAGISNIIEHGKNGFIVDAANSSALFQEILLLKNSCTSLRSISENAVSSVQKITWEEYYISISDALQSVTAKQTKDENL